MAVPLPPHARRYSASPAGPSPPTLPRLHIPNSGPMPVAPSGSPAFGQQQQHAAGIPLPMTPGAGVVSPGSLHRQSLQGMGYGATPPTPFTPDHRTAPSLTFPLPQTPISAPRPQRNGRRNNMSISLQPGGGPPKAPTADRPSRNPSTPAVEKKPAEPKKKKIVVTLPKEDAGLWPSRVALEVARVDELDEPRAPDATTREQDPGSLPLENGLPEAIDIYLPGKDAWEARRQRAITERLSKLGIETAPTAMERKYSDIENPDEFSPMPGLGAVGGRLNGYHSKAASISSPADPGMLDFKLRRFLDSSPEQQRSPLSSPTKQPPPRLGGHASSMSLALPNTIPSFGPSSPAYSTASSNPSYFNPRLNTLGLNTLGLPLPAMGGSPMSRGVSDAPTTPSQFPSSLLEVAEEEELEQDKEQDQEQDQEQEVDVGEERESEETPTSKDSKPRPLSFAELSRGFGYGPEAELDKAEGAAEEEKEDAQQTEVAETEVADGHSRNPSTAFSHCSAKSTTNSFGATRNHHSLSIEIPSGRLRTASFGGHSGTSSIDLPVAPSSAGSLGAPPAESIPLSAQAPSFVPGASALRPSVPEFVPRPAAAATSKLVPTVAPFVPFTKVLNAAVAPFVPTSAPAPPPVPAKDHDPSLSLPPIPVSSTNDQAETAEAVEALAHDLPPTPQFNFPVRRRSSSGGALNPSIPEFVPKTFSARVVGGRAAQQEGKEERELEDFHTNPSDDPASLRGRPRNWSVASSSPQTAGGESATADWSGFEPDTEDDERLEMYSNPSDEERALQERLTRRMLRAQKKGQPVPARAHIARRESNAEGSISPERQQYDAEAYDFVSNPSDEERVYAQRGAVSPARSAFGPQHPGAQFTFSQSDHARRVSEIFSQSSQQPSYGRRGSGSVSPDRQQQQPSPFRFGAPQQQQQMPSGPRPAAATLSHKSGLSAAAPEFRPGAFTFQAALTMPTPPPQEQMASLFQPGTLLRAAQGREKRMRVASPSDLVERAEEEAYEQDGEVEEAEFGEFRYPLGEISVSAQQDVWPPRRTSSLTFGANSQPRPENANPPPLPSESSLKENRYKRPPIPPFNAAESDEPNRKRVESGSSSINIPNGERPIGKALEIFRPHPTAVSATPVPPLSAAGFRQPQQSPAYSASHLSDAAPSSDINGRDHALLYDLSRSLQTVLHRLDETVREREQDRRHDPEQLMDRVLAGLQDKLEQIAEGVRSSTDGQGELDVDYIRAVMFESQRETTERIANELRAVQEHRQTSVLETDEGRQGLVDAILARLPRPAPAVDERAVVDALARLLNQRLEPLEAAVTRDPAVERLTLLAELIAGLRPHLPAPTSLDIDVLTSRLSDSVKPHLHALIDLASDKKETASIIVRELAPYFTALEPHSDAEAMQAGISDRIVRELAPRLAELKSAPVDLTLVVAELRDILLPHLSQMGDASIKASELLDRHEVAHRDMASRAAAVDERLSDIPELLAHATDALQLARRDFEAKSSIVGEMLQLQEAVSANAELQAELGKAQSTHGKLRSEKDRLIERLRAMEEERDYARSEAEAARANARNKDAELAKLEATNGSLIHSLSGLTTKLNDAEEQIKNLHDQKQAWFNADRDYQVRIRQLELERDAEVEKTKTLETARQQWLEERALFVSSQSQDREERAQLQLSLQELRKQIVEEGARDSQELTKARERIDNLTRAQATGKHTIATAQQRASELANRVRELERKAEAAQERLAVADTESALLAEATEAIEQMANRERQLNEDLESSRNTVAELESENATLKKSLLESERRRAQIALSLNVPAPTTSNGRPGTEMSARTTTDRSVNNTTPTPRLTGSAASIYAPQPIKASTLAAAQSSFDTSPSAIRRQTASPALSVMSSATVQADDGWFYEA